jgi:O-succinylbenzoic acid--CoA ligase
MPDHPALIVDGLAISYADLNAEADDLGRRLSTLEVGEGDRVAVLLSNGLDVVAALHACGRLGAILVPLNTRLTADEVAFQLANTRPRVLLAHPRYASVVGTSTAQRVAADARPTRVVWVDGEAVGEDVGEDEDEDEDEGVGVGVDVDVDVDVGAGPGGLTIPRGPRPVALRHVRPSAVALRDAVAVDAPQAIVHTSGTTGTPKGAVLTWGNQAWSAAGSALRLGAMTDDRWLAVLPLFHVGGLAILLRAAWQGATVVVHERFDAAAVWRSLNEDGITMVSLVPTMLDLLLEERGLPRAPRTLRTALLGGGAASAGLLARAVRAGWPLSPTYGLTEACSQVATCPPGWRPEDGLAAPPLPFTELRVVDANGALAPEGSEGEIVVRGPTVFAGYWRDAHATNGAVDAEGWLRTGDLGRLDGQGRIAVSGRRSDLVVSGGENVYPAEVEAVLCQHPAVAEACVVGVPDDRWGERVVAAIVARGALAEVAPEPSDGQEGHAAPEAGPLTERGTDADTHAEAVAEAEAAAEAAAAAEDAAAAAIIAFARVRLAGYKVPCELRWVDALPRTASGKVRRAEVRAEWGSGGVGHEGGRLGP